MVFISIVIINTFCIPLVTGTVARLVSLVAQVCETSFFFQLDCIQINTHKSLKALFLNFQTFFTGTHIEPVGTHYQPPSLSRWLPRNYIHKLDFLLGKDYQVFRKINIINIILRRTKLPAVVFSKSHQKSIFLLYVFHSLISARHSLSLSWIILTVSLLC